MPRGSRARSTALLLILFLLAPALAHAQNGTEPIRATDLLKIQQLGDVTVSPDGRHIAYTAKQIAETDSAAYEYRTHLFYLSADALDQPRQLTYGERGGSDPAWHPDGDRLAFVRPVEDTPQLFILSLYGGEAYQLTDFEHGATNPRWSPDGTQILFAATLSEEDVHEMMGGMPPWPDERPGRQRGDAQNATPDPTGSLQNVRAWLEANAEDDDPRVLTRLDLQGEFDLEPELDFRHLFVVDATTPGAAPTPITQGFYSFGGGTWLPNGQQILLDGAMAEDQHPDRVRDGDLFIVDPDGTRFRRLLDVDGYALSNPAPSPDGRLITFLARDLDDPGYAQTELGTFTLDGQSPPEMLTLGFDRSLYDVRWDANNWFVYFVAASEGGFPLYRLPVYEGRPARPTPQEEAEDEDEDAALADTTAADSLQQVQARVSFARADLTRRNPEVERLTSQERGIRSYDLSTATIYYVLTEPTNPYELYAATADFSQERRLTDHNASWLADKKLTLPQAETLRRDTLEIDYWVMEPTFAERRERYPLLLEIHGGPMAMWGPGEATMWHEFQFLAAQGFGIVYANPRGSGGYGHAFKTLNYQDWGDGPAGDVLAAASEAADDERWVDEDRQVVTGGSYAGYLTAWIVGHDDRFQAAVAQRGVYDLTTFLGEGNAWRLVPSHFGGYPWGPRDAMGDLGTEPGRSADASLETLRRNSPLTYVDRIRTPLLIMHADDDLRTGVIQSEMLYKSLKILGRPVEYVRYPDAGHDLSRTGDPTQRMDRVLRIYEFLARYVMGDGSTDSSR
ncbi:MAG: prolyl oligopeptidase family serine peptidase [Bacteroidetes bacterium]|jgi:dipeptidyl aminopeptidase/acylaminoacyl peptidase|nr:prolyl oligopeptidase family serine peptidase [Bacteroidota bacterium]